MLQQTTEKHLGRDFREELLPVALDNLAKIHPQSPFALIASDATAEGGFFEITFQDLANAVNHAAWWLETTLGRPASSTFPTVTYIGGGDIRYYALLLGSIKVGYKIMFPSTANSPSMLEKLMQDGKSTTFLYSPSNPLAVQIAASTSLGCVAVPELEYFLETTAQSYPYTKTPVEAAHEPVCVFHTSGTTGFPKVRPMSHAHLATRQSTCCPTSTTGRQGISRSNVADRRRLVLGSMGYVSMLLGLIGPIWGGRTSVMAPLNMSQADFTPEIFKALAEKANVTSAFVFPKLAIDLANDEDSLQTIESLQHLSFGGGSLPTEISAKLSARTQLNSCWSSTETGVFALQEPDADALDCVVVDDPRLNLDFVEYSPRRYELQVRRQSQVDSTEAFPWHQAVFTTFPDLDVYKTGDLFSPHPIKPFHWRSEGRIDDTIILSLGNSVNPGPTEQAAQSCPGVAAAMGIGQMKPSLGLLIELEDGVAMHEVKYAVQHAIDTSQRDRQSFERVQPNRLIWASPHKPLPRSAKGLIRRKEALELYRHEIEACYSPDVGKAGSLAPLARSFHTAPVVA